MDGVPVIQVLSKKDFTEQHVVPPPSALPLLPLAPSAIRVKTALLSLTANNLTIARIGHLVGWWDVHPLPPSIPPEFGDPAKYGRISAWGFADVLESNIAGVSAGERIFGYLPIGTLPVDLSIELTLDGRQAKENSPFRQHVWAFYNLYMLVSQQEEWPKDLQNEGWDSLMLVLFESAFIINRFTFSWDPARLIHPQAAKDNEVWNLTRADLKDAIVVIFAASGKTALSLAHQLRHARPAVHQPRAVVGVTSPRSEQFVIGTGFYDRAVLYDSMDSLTSSLSVDGETRVILCNFGGSVDLIKRFSSLFRHRCKDLLVLGVGTEPSQLSAEEFAKGAKQMEELGLVQFNAPLTKSQSYGDTRREKVLGGKPRCLAFIQGRRRDPGIEVDLERGHGSCKGGLEETV